MSDELEAWRKWLHQYDAAPVPGPLHGWTVTIDGVGVVVELDRGQVRASVPLMPGLEGLAIVAKEQALYTKKRVFTGDAELDDGVVMHVPLIAAYAAFDAEGRKDIQRLVGLGVTASGGMLRWSPGQVVAIGPVIASMVALATRLAQSEASSRVAIARIIERDPNPSVRSTYERAFGHAPDIRDARALLVSEGTSDDDVRLQVLALQVGDPGLSHAVRNAALETVLAEFPLAKVEPLVMVMPRGTRSHYLLAYERLAAATTIDDKRRLARMALHFAHGVSLGASEIKALARALVPLGVPQAIDFFLACIARLDGGVVDLGFEGLMILDAQADAILARISEPLQRRMARAVTGLAWGKPERVGALFHRLYERYAATDGELHTSFLSTMASAHRTLREAGRAPHPMRAQHLALARELLGGRSNMTPMAACDLLAEVGEISDLATLSPMTEGFFRSTVIKEAARSAIAKIMERENVRAETGALALSDANVGGLSEAEP